MLKASHKNSSSGNNKSTNNNKVENGVKETNGIDKQSTDVSEPVDKKRRILEKIKYEDLDDGNDSNRAPELKLSKVCFNAYTVINFAYIPNKLKLFSI